MQRKKEGLIIQHVEAQAIKRPGEVLGVFIMEWVSRDVGTAAMLQAVYTECGNHLNEREESTLRGWYQEESDRYAQQQALEQLLELEVADE